MTKKGRQKFWEMIKKFLEEEVKKENKRSPEILRR